MNGQKELDLSVLYVEDEAATQEEIAVFLKRRVKKLVLATNGEEGLARFREDRPDLVVTDIRMPVMDGLKMARAMREEHRDIPIIVTTAHSDTANMLEAIDIGIDQYVLKPVAADKLSTALDRSAKLIEYRRSTERYLEERERMIIELQDALAKVKTLSGMLPVCASCKKIRDDNGYWQQIEEYISAHSEAEFSHGICPVCAEKLYGKYYKKEP